MAYGQWWSWICAFIFLWQREVSYILERKQCTTLPTQPCNPMGGTINMEHTVSKPVITHKVLCEFSDDDHCTLGNSPLVLLLPCARCCSWWRSCCRHAFVQTGRGTYIHVLPIPKTGPNPDLHKAAFSPKTGRTAYWIYPHLAEIPCIWHQEQE